MGKGKEEKKKNLYARFGVTSLAYWFHTSVRQYGGLARPLSLSLLCLSNRQNEAIDCLLAWWCASCLYPIALTALPEGAGMNLYTPGRIRTSNLIDLDLRTTLAGGARWCVVF